SVYDGGAHGKLEAWEWHRRCRRAAKNQIIELSQPFYSRMNKREKRPLGDLFNLTNYGVNLTRLAPQGVSALRHAHSRQDEFVYILQGEPTLVTNTKKTLLQTNIYTRFKTSTNDGHQLVNRTSDDVVFLEIGDRSASDTVVYPDDDIQAVLGDDGKWQFAHKNGVPY
ncbi:MAG TPA: cupin domain-containing protein, partial [Candidatus Saccharimonadales bacterium]|nr:cupin domain-containing protein [Candidatus Saccharimonadales bacterium]